MIRNESDDVRLVVNDEDALNRAGFSHGWKLAEPLTLSQPTVCHKSATMLCLAARWHGYQFHSLGWVLATSFAHQVKKRLTDRGLQTGILFALMLGCSPRQLPRAPQIPTAANPVVPLTVTTSRPAFPTGTRFLRIIATNDFHGAL